MRVALVASVLSACGQARRQAGPLDELSPSNDRTVEVCVPVDPAFQTALVPALTWGSPEWALEPTDDVYRLTAIDLDADQVEVLEQLLVRHDLEDPAPPTLGWVVDGPGGSAELLAPFGPRALPTDVSFLGNQVYSVVLRVALTPDGVERGWGRIDINGLAYTFDGREYVRSADATSYVGLSSAARDDGPGAACGPEW